MFESNLYVRAGADEGRGCHSLLLALGGLLLAVGAALLSLARLGGGVLVVGVILVGVIAVEVVLVVLVVLVGVVLVVLVLVGLAGEPSTALGMILSLMMAPIS